MQQQMLRPGALRPGAAKHSVVKSQVIQSNANKVSSPRPSTSISAMGAMGRFIPPDAPKEGVIQGGREWMETILSRFGPVRDRAQNTTTLDFEKPLVELDKRIKEVRSEAGFRSILIKLTRHCCAHTNFVTPT